MYGAMRVAAQWDYSRRPYTIKDATWQHGWHPANLMYDPLKVTSGDDSPGKIHLVARNEERDYLASKNFTSQAIGLPYAYVLELGNSDVARIPNSILIMPSHSSRLKILSRNPTGDLLWQYALHSQRKGQPVYVCLHDEDLRHRSANIAWATEFSVVAGAAVDDANAYWRMRYLFSRFDAVVTDSEGSHLPMAVATGARVTVLPANDELLYESLAHEKHEDAGPPPQSLRDLLWLDAPWLYSSPTEAQRNQEWGLRQMGSSNLLRRRDFAKLQHNETNVFVTGQKSWGAFRKRLGWARLRRS